MNTMGIVGCLILCAGPAAAGLAAEPATPSTVAVAGKIIDDQGKAVGGVIVSLQRDGWHLANQTPWEFGEFQFRTAGPEGAAILTVIQPGFWPVRTNLQLRA